MLMRRLRPREVARLAEVELELNFLDSQGRHFAMNRVPVVGDIAPKGLCQSPAKGQPAACTGTVGTPSTRRQEEHKRGSLEFGLLSTRLQNSLRTNLWELRNPRFPDPMTKKKLTLPTKRHCLLFAGILPLAFSVERL